MIFLLIGIRLIEVQARNKLLNRTWVVNFSALKPVVSTKKLQTNPRITTAQFGMSHGRSFTVGIGFVGKEVDESRACQKF